MTGNWGKGTVDIDNIFKCNITIRSQQRDAI